jgi:sensor histidine kinase YesM
VENAIKHGLLHKKGQKNLRIAFMLKGQLVCEVEDNGIGRKASMEIKQRQSKGHKSFSIGAIKNRFEIMKTQYTQNIGVEYIDLEKDGKSTGTLVRIIMPYRPKY